MDLLQAINGVFQDIHAVFLVQTMLSRCCGFTKEKLEHTWRSSSAASDRLWAVFCGWLGADWSGFVIVCSCGGEWVQHQNEWFFVGQTPAGPCLLLLKWLTCTSNFPVPHPDTALFSWHLLYTTHSAPPITHIFVCWVGNMARLQGSVRIGSVATDDGLNLDGL